MTVTVINQGGGGGGGLSGSLTDSFGELTTLNLTLASLASSTGGVGRQSDMIANPDGERELRLYIKITQGTSPTSARAAYVYLLLGNEDASYRTDGASNIDSGLTVLNAQQICALRNKISGAATGDVMYKEVLTRIAAPYWGIAIVHDTGVNLDSNSATHFVKYQYVTPSGG